MRPLRWKEESAEQHLKSLDKYCSSWNEHASQEKSGLVVIAFILILPLKTISRDCREVAKIMLRSHSLHCEPVQSKRSHILSWVDFKPKSHMNLTFDYIYAKHLYKGKLVLPSNMRYRSQLFPCVTCSLSSFPKGIMLLTSYSFPFHGRPLVSCFLCCYFLRETSSHRTVFNGNPWINILGNFTIVPSQVPKAFDAHGMMGTLSPELCNCCILLNVNCATFVTCSQGNCEVFTFRELLCNYN